MKIHMIWAQDKYGSTWMIDAWDDDTVAENYEGWREAVEKAHNDRDLEIRVISADLDIDRVYDVFKQPTAGDLVNIGPSVEAL